MDFDFTDEVKKFTFDPTQEECQELINAGLYDEAIAKINDHVNDCGCSLESSYLLALAYSKRDEIDDHQKAFNLLLEALHKKSANGIVHWHLIIRRSVDLLMNVAEPLTEKDNWFVVKAIADSVENESGISVLMMPTEEKNIESKFAPFFHMSHHELTYNINNYCFQHDTCIGLLRLFECSKNFNVGSFNVLTFSNEHFIRFKEKYGEQFAKYWYRLSDEELTKKIEQTFLSIVSNTYSELLNIVPEYKLFDNYAIMRPEQMMAMRNNLNGNLHTISMARFAQRFPEFLLNIHKIMGAVQALQYKELFVEDKLRGLDLSDTQYDIANIILNDFSMYRNSEESYLDDLIHKVMILLGLDDFYSIVDVRTLMP